MEGDKNPEFCFNCGTPLDENSKFCKNCGAPISKSGKIENEENKNNENQETEQIVNKKENLQEEASELNITPSNDNFNVENKVRIYHKNVGVAVVLSLFLACLGQFYNGQILKGIIFLIIWTILYYISPILVLLFIIYACYDAYINAKKINENNGNYFYTTGVN